MATLETGIFGLRFSNDANGRLRFVRLLDGLRTPWFYNQLKGDKGLPLPVHLGETQWMPSHGRDLLTFCLRESIVALESYTASGVILEAMVLRCATREIREASINPGSLGKGGARALYCRLPALLNPEFAMSQRDPELWNDTKAFYTQVRNPLFHGHKVDDDLDPEPLRQACEFLWRIFRWVDGWHDPRGVWAQAPVRWATPDNLPPGFFPSVNPGQTGPQETP